MSTSFFLEPKNEILSTIIILNTLRRWYHLKFGFNDLMIYVRLHVRLLPCAFAWFEYGRACICA